MSAVIRAVDPGAMPDLAEGLIRERDFRYGRIRYLANDYGVGAMLEHYGEYSEGEVSLFRRLLRPGNLVVSAGGNIGCHLIPISRLVGGHGRVVTFEPQAFIRERLLLPNLTMNGCTNVEVRPEALGAASGVVSLPAIDYTVPNNFGGMECRADGPCKVLAVTLDSLFLSACDFLMLDVEGFELAALQGARATILKYRPLLYVEIDRESTRESVLHYMKDELGYELLFHTPQAFNPKNYAGNKVNTYGAICSVMCLGIPA